jgi:hypothetical protein
MRSWISLNYVPSEDMMYIYTDLCLVAGGLQEVKLNSRRRSLDLDQAGRVGLGTSPNSRNAVISKRSKILCIAMT